MHHKWIIGAALCLSASSTMATAPPERVDPARKDNISALLREEDQPRAMIGLMLEHAIYPGHLGVVRPPNAPPKGIEVARDRIATSPGVYAPELERRLLALLPERIADGDALAAIGLNTIDRSLDVVLDDAPYGAGGEGRLVTLMSLVKLLGRAHAEPVLRRFFDTAHALGVPASDMFDAAKAAYGKGDERVLPYWYGASFIWSCAAEALRAAKELGSPMFIEDCLRIAEQIRARPNDGFIEGFTTQWSFEYLRGFVQERPELYARVAALTDAGANAAWNSAAVDVELYAQMEAEKMRGLLVAAGKWPPPEQP